MLHNNKNPGDFTWFDVRPIDDKMSIAVTSDLCMTHTQSMKEFMLDNPFESAP